MEKFYITTAIDYANSTPHLGTAYEKIGADVIARYKRLCGFDVHFVMGNDEHSQNVRKKAEELGLDPKVYCDQMAVKFQETWKKLHISNDFFIQTTSEAHRTVVRDLAGRIHTARDSQGRPVIYKAAYEGHYCVSCEAFYKDADLKDGVCPNHKVKPEWIREENYFFRLSAYSDALKKLYAENPNFLLPKSKRNEVLQVLEKGLEDVSISRANTAWGVKLPFDESAVAYVWFDALINYISAVGPIGGEKYNRYWPADLHVIGKDITRFHCLIWPAMLLAAGLPLPKAVWAHGFISVKGEKMSKSLGNVRDPNAVADAFGAEVVRYHLMREVSWDADGDFSEERLTLRYNADLANDLGNLLNRTVTMSRKYLGETTKPVASTKFGEEAGQSKTQWNRYREAMDRYEIAGALEAIFVLVSQSNVLIDRTQPWSLAKDPSNLPVLQELFSVILERMYWVSLALLPVMPQKMEEILHTLGRTLGEARADFLKGPQIEVGKSYTLAAPKPLFPRIQSA